MDSYNSSFITCSSITDSNKTTSSGYGGVSGVKWQQLHKINCQFLLLFCRRTVLSRGSLISVLSPNFPHHLLISGKYFPLHFMIVIVLL